MPSELRVGGHRVFPRLNRVVADGQTVQLEPKVMAVLLRLAQHPGEVVTKEQLKDDVWEGVNVTEDVLVRAVGELRRAWGDDSGAPRLIETIRKRGYRLIAPVVYEFPDAAGAPLEDVGRRSPAEASKHRHWTTGVALVALAVLAVLAALAGLGRFPARSSPRFAPLTSLEGNEFDPALSPDGTRVVFAWDGGANGPTHLYAKVVGSESTLRLTAAPGSDRAPVWSSDGSRIGFLHFEDGACRILSVSALGGPARRLADCTSGEHPRFSWSPDGRWLAVSRGGPGVLAGRLQLIAVDSTEIREVTADSGGAWADSSPSFSPDGRSLVFIHGYSDSVGDLYRVPVTGGTPRRLTNDNADIMGFTWAGRSLILSSNRAGMYSLWRVDAEGGEPALLAGGGRKIKHPSASADGTLVAYESWNYDMNLWQEPFQGRPGRLAAATDEWTFEPSFSPDGRRLAFVSTRSGSYELWVCDGDGRNLVRVTSFGGPYVGAPRWSPDGASLAFVARPRGRAEAYVVPVSGGPPRRVLPDPTDQIAPSWSGDGQGVYFGSPRDGTWQIQHVRLADGRIRRVTESGGYAALESPDGRFVYHTRIDRPGLWRVPVAGGAAEPVAPGMVALNPEHWAGWGFLGEGIYWTASRPGDQPPQLLSLPLGASIAVPLATLTELGWPGATVSPDARTVVYSRVDHHESNLTLLSMRAGPP